ncbi:MAG: hypothetical protein ACXWUG_05145 [Polyangiales bacterium]
MKWLLLAFLLTSCLPSDTRPTPGEADVTLRGSESIKSGIPASAFSDGWSITFNRFLVTLGGASFGGDNCTAYENDFYRRIFDGSVLDSQKVAQKFALGTCEFGFRVSTPDADTILMTGVTEQDKSMLRTGGTDPYSNGLTGISIYVSGKATKGAVTKTFTWPFRGRRVVYGPCVPDITTLTTGSAPLYTFTGSSQQVVELGIRGEPLFASSLDPKKAKLQFDPYARADDEFGDKNGDITLDELGKMTLMDAGITVEDTVDPEADAGTPDGGVPGFKTFEDFVYLGLAPHVVGLGQHGFCGVQISKPRD